MNPLDDIKNAAIGWVDLLGARSAGAEKFNATRQGLVTAIVCYVLMVLFTSIVQSVSLYGSFPRYDTLFFDQVWNALPLLVIYLVVIVTVRFLKPTAGYYGMLVSLTWALTFLLVIGLPLSLFFGSTFAPALQGIIGYSLYRAARDVGKLNFGISLCFAILTIVLLVAAPKAIYMAFAFDLPTPD